MLIGHEAVDQLGDHGRTPQPAAYPDFPTDLAGPVHRRLQTDVMETDGRPVVRRTGHRNLELARQIREFRMQARPLTDDLGHWTRIDNLVCGGTGELVSGHIANAIARCLDGVHFHARQLFQDHRNVLEFGPVELDVLPRGEVPVATVISARDMRQLAHLPGRQRAIGHRYPQHIGVELQVEPVHQPQGPELVLGELARQAALHLVCKLCCATRYESGVEFVISIHARLHLSAGDHTPAH